MARRFVPEVIVVIDRELIDISQQFFFRKMRTHKRITTESRFVQFHSVEKATHP